MRSSQRDGGELVKGVSPEGIRQRMVLLSEDAACFAPWCFDLQSSHACAVRSYLLVLHSGDVPKPTALEKLVWAMDTRPEVGIAFVRDSSLLERVRMMSGIDLLEGPNRTVPARGWFGLPPSRKSVGWMRGRRGRLQRWISR
jgi:hypothetical protein